MTTGWYFAHSPSSPIPYTSTANPSILYKHPSNENELVPSKYGNTDFNVYGNKLRLLFNYFVIIYKYWLLLLVLLLLLLLLESED